MTFFERCRRLLARGEVDDIERSTEVIVGLRKETRDRHVQIRSLRHAADDRHPDLSEAIARRSRNRAR